MACGADRAIACPDIVAPKGKKNKGGGIYSMRNGLTFRTFDYVDATMDNRRNWYSVHELKKAYHGQETACRKLAGRWGLWRIHFFGNEKKSKGVGIEYGYCLKKNYGMKRMQGPSTETQGEFSWTEGRERNERDRKTTVSGDDVSAGPKMKLWTKHT